MQKLKAYRNPSNRRYYTHNQYVEYIGKIVQDKDKIKTVVYARVSTSNQKYDFKNQVNFLR